MWLMAGLMGFPYKKRDACFTRVIIIGCDDEVTIFMS